MEDIQNVFQFTQKRDKGLLRIQAKSCLRLVSGVPEAESILSIRKQPASTTVVMKSFSDYKDIIKYLGLQNALDHIWNFDETNSSPPGALPSLGDLVSLGDQVRFPTLCMMSEGNGLHVNMIY